MPIILNDIVSSSFLNSFEIYLHRLLALFQKTNEKSSLNKNKSKPAIAIFVLSPLRFLITTIPTYIFT